MALSAAGCSGVRTFLQGCLKLVPCAMPSVDNCRRAWLKGVKGSVWAQVRRVAVYPSATWWVLRGLGGRSECFHVARSIAKCPSRATIRWRSARR